jgi:hypothetical protein
MSKTFSTAFTSTYNLTDPDTTFTSSASVIPIGYATPAVYGAAGTAWTVTNAGQLKSGGSANGFGVELLGGGAVTNLSTGIIQAYKAVVLGAPGNVVNAGLIRSQNIYSAVALNQGGTLTNTGTIAGGAGTAASLAAGFTNRVVVGAGGVFNGVVNGGNSIGSAFASTLELNSGATQGTLYGLGSQFVNFAQVTIDSGANWAIAGAIGLGASIVDSGILSPVTLVAGAQVTVASGGIILAPGGGTFSAVSLNGAGTLVNFGTINSPSFYSVSATGGGTVINAAGGVIANRFFATGTNPHGATGNTGPGVTLVNSGRVAEAFIRAANISVTNTSAGTIAGDGVGLVLGTTVGTAYLLNAGVITGSFLAVSGGYATAGSGATVTNQSSGTIGGTGSYFGVRFSGNGTIVNAGTIGGSKVGISIGGSGSVTIQAGGTVFGSRYAVQFTNTVNSYTRLAIDPARSISGKVKGGRLSTLELMSAASAGTLTGLGSQYVSFFTTTIDSGATWTIGGTALIANRGQRLVNSGTLKIAGTLNTYSNVTAGSNGIQFVSGSTSRLIAHAGAAFSGTIDGGGGTLELATGYYPAKLYALATQLTNFANVTVDSGANWKIFGTIPNAAPLIDAGLLRDGVTLGTGARLTVALSGTVANSFGSAIAGAGTVFDAGTIAGATYGVQFASGFANRLILAPGGTVFGTVSGGNTIGATASSTLELASGASAGTLSGLGSHYLNFGNIAVDSGANWALSGSNAIGVGVILTAINATLTNVGTLVNNGGIVVTGGIATNTGLIAGAGVGLQFRNNGFLSNSGSIQSSNSYGVDFYGNRSVATRGTIVNSASGSIGGSVGVRGRYGSTTVDNSGSIGGSTAAVVLNNFQTNRVIDRAGAVFGGTVNGGNSGTYLYLSTLELGTGSGTGTIGGIGSSFTGFGNLTVDAGASWALTGSNNFSGGRVSVAGTLGSGLVVTGGIATNTGLIAGAGVGLQFRNNGSLSNSGSIQSSNFFGVDFYGNLDTRGTSGTIVNSASGSIGGSVGVRGRYGSTTVDNSGSIGGSSAAVLLNAGQTNRVIDRAGAVFGGTVNGGNSGTYLYLSTLELGTGSGTGTIGGIGSSFTGFGNLTVDAGASWALTGSNNFSGGRVSVAGTLGSGLVVTGGIATNTGLIAGAGVGLQFRNNGSLSNSGSIQSSNFFGVDFYGNLDTRGTSGTIVNSASGSIGGSVGVRGRYGSTTVDNSGSIGGSSAAVLLNAGQTNRVIDRAGAVFGGTVNGGNSGTYLYLSTLELASAAGTGTIAGLGSQFTGFGNIAVDSGANWVLSGSNTIGVGVTLTAINATLTSFGTLVNNGGIVLDPSTLVVGNLLGTGSVTIQSGSTLEVTGTIASTETIVFQGANAYLHLDSPNNAYGFVNGFDNTDRIDLKGINPISVYYSAGKLNFITGAATRSAFPLSTVSNNPVQSSRSADGANVAALCFLPDTLIQTPSGPVKVQDLQTGDIVTTFAGAERPIAWIGTGAVLATRGKRGPATPVIIRKSAFAANVPNRDLRVTKGHSFLFDNVLIPAEFLVNHRTIEWDDRAQEVVLYHVELESHDILIANGAPAESYRDDGNRWLFRNANTGWDQPAKEPCAAVLTGGPIVDAAWRRLLDRAGPRPGLPLTEDSDLHLLLDGVRTDATAHSGNRYRFRLPKRPSTVVIFSRAAAPQELGLSRDPRLLGVAIQHLLVSKGPKRAAMDAHDHRLAEGFHGFEPKLGLRWTDGCAVVPTALFDGFDGPMEVELRVAATAHYPDEEHAAA